MVPTDGFTGAASASRERQQGTLARQRPNNETEERNSGHVGSGRCCHAWHGCSAVPAAAAEVKPGGALDITITGFARFEAGGGEQDDSEPRQQLRPRPRLPQRHRGPRPGPRQERADRARVWCHDRVRGRHQQHPQHRRELGLPARRLGRGADGRRGRCRRQQHHRRPDDRGRHGRYRRLELRRRRIAGEGVFPTETDDATKIRYYTPSFGGFSLGVSYTPTVETSAAAPTTASSSPARTAPIAMEAENIIEGALVYDGDLGGVGLKASVVGQYGKLKNGAEADRRRRLRRQRLVQRRRRCRARPVRLQAGRQRRHRQCRRHGPPVHDRRHRLRLRPGEHLDHLRLDLGLRTTTSPTQARLRQAVQPRVLGRLCPGAGPGAGGRRRLLRPRYQRATTGGHRRQGLGRRGSVRLTF